ncbi:Hypothetical predicted protein [Paramuricea clavata]|uniref:Uncharacterized protein n=1 Tax=Paramuricea clavata TaxID=317549 RepID=A0A6S7HYK7_PARCT|nr:Hypothetical predicted protein [Paramuricea clavata]
MNSTRCCVLVLFLCIYSIYKTQGYNFNACPTSENDFLNVTYESLVVKCGTKYDLELVTPPPKISFSHAVQEKFYEVLMIDPDAPSEKNPKCRSWLHMLLSDVKGSDLQNGISANANAEFNVVTEYKPPTPPKGTGYHRYIHVAFGHEEPLNRKEKITRCGFDIDLFTKKHTLHLTPDANNMFKTITK